MQVSANISGRETFPITIHFNNGDQHLTVAAAKELAEKLIERLHKKVVKSLLPITSEANNEH